MQVYQVALENTDGHYKFYRAVAVDGYVFAFWGRIGTIGQYKKISGSSAHTLAVSHVLEKMNEKQLKGYRVVDGFRSSDDWVAKSAKHVCNTLRSDIGASIDEEDMKTKFQIAFEDVSVSRVVLGESDEEEVRVESDAIPKTSKRVRVKKSVSDLVDGWLSEEDLFPI